jgi:hypothetical protein
MIDPALERCHADCVELVDAWRAFYDLVSISIKSPDQITPQLETNFMASKARVAMLHDSFMESLDRDKSMGANMLALVNRSITLRQVAKLGSADHKKIEIEWHEVYLLLNETVTSLEEKREKLANVSAASHAMGKATKRVANLFKAFLGSVWFKLLVVLLVLGGIVGAMMYFADDLRKHPATKDYFAGFIRFQRNVLNMEAPYATLAEFRDAAFADTFKDKFGGIRDWTPSGQTKEALALSFLRISSPKNQELKDKASAAADGTGFNLIASSGGQNLAMIFFWEDIAPAVEFERLWNEAVPADSQFAGKRKANVFCVAYSDKPGNRDAIVTHFFETMPPNARKRDGE